MQRLVSLLICSLVLTGLTSTVCLASDNVLCEDLLSFVLLPKDGSLIDPSVRDAIFQCTGLTESVDKLDQLDRDFLLGWAVKSPSFAEFSQRQTKTDPPIAYTELADHESLKFFYDYIQSLDKK